MVADGQAVGRITDQRIQDKLVGKRNADHHPYPKRATRALKETAVQRDKTIGQLIDESLGDLPQ
jgi:hypothetical protein